MPLNNDADVQKALLLEMELLVALQQLPGPDRDFMAENVCNGRIKGFERALEIRRWRANGYGGFIEVEPFPDAQADPPKPRGRLKDL